MNTNHTQSIRFLIFTIILLCVFSIPFKNLMATADASIENDSEYKKYNTDGRKYEFTRHYISSLIYLKQNEVRQKKAEALTFEDLKKKGKREDFLHDLVLNNANLRIARNLLKNFKTGDNGLMLKIIDSFTRMCEEQIGFNNSEKQILEDLDKGKIQREAFMTQLKTISSQRKESLNNLLESSLFVNKVLVSNKTDRYGQFYMLGITKKERKTLLAKLDQFQGEEYKGKVRPGQTFIEASVASIRDFLEDKSWGTLDG